ncbi:MAG: hypothetical protein ACJ76D_11015 [Solirubrobacterales bacterium]
MLVVGFEDGKFSGEILAELRRLREHDIVRLVDLLFVAKDANGEIEAIEHSDLAEAEAEAFGALAGALMGMGAAGEEGAEAGAVLGAAAVDERGSVINPDNVWYLADAIPPGTSAGIALLEHRWAIPLRDAIENAGGEGLVDAWIHPQDLVAAGAEVAQAG